MDARMRCVVDRLLGREAGVAADRVREPGVHVIPAPAGAREVVALDLTDAAWVRAPEHMLGRLRDLSALTPAAVVDPALWESLAGVVVESTHGPTVHAYTVDEPSIEDAAVVTATVDRVAELRTVVSPEEWLESGFGGAVGEAFVLADDEGVCAAANLTGWAGAPTDVGVLVHPRARRRGLAAVVGAAATRGAVRTHGRARWRAFETNGASRAVARRLGFAEYGRSLVVRLSA